MRILAFEPGSHSVPAGLVRHTLRRNWFWCETLRTAQEASTGVQSMRRPSTCLEGTSPSSRSPIHNGAETPTPRRPAIIGAAKPATMTPAATQDAAAGLNPRKNPVSEARGKRSLGTSTSASCVAADITNQLRYPHPNGPAR